MAKNNDKQICSLCRRVITIRSQYDMPIYSPQTGIGICRDCIEKTYDAIQAAAPRESAKPKKKKSTGIPLGEIIARHKPHIIKEYLDKYIIKQELAKKTLSVALYNHYKRMKYDATRRDDSPVIDKSNVIMIGPSGCGKTAILQTLARLLDVPFAITDTSSLTEAGYVGNDVEVAVRNLYYAAEQDIERTEHGIIYLDEFDKIARKSGENNSITADPGHEGVQQSLLKMLEGSDVEFTAHGQRKHPEAPTIKVNTTHILFIVGGAFVGLDQVIEKRLKKNTSAIGFGAAVTGEADRPSTDDLLRQVTPEDLVKVGIIPEIVGRLPIICTLETLDEDSLLTILTEPVNAPVRQYKELLKLDNVELDFTVEALREVARRAIARKTGARSLRGILEEIMLDIMYDIPKDERHRRVTITVGCVKNGDAPLIDILPELPKAVTMPESDSDSQKETELNSSSSDYIFH